MKLTIDYVELVSEDLAASKTFLTEVFGWAFTDYGDTYVAFSRESAGIEGGITAGNPNGGPLIVIYTETIADALENVRSGGGDITKDIFGFPGGSRFEFVAPGGIRLAVWTGEADPKDA